MATRKSSFSSDMHLHHITRLAKHLWHSAVLKHVLILLWKAFPLQWSHMGSMAPQITGKSTVCSTVYSNKQTKRNTKASHCWPYVSTNQISQDQISKGPVMRTVFGCEEFLWLNNLLSPLTKLGEDIGIVSVRLSIHPSVCACICPHGVSDHYLEK